jgi:DNA-3-methyladenine glycosylase I
MVGAHPKNLKNRHLDPRKNSRESLQTQGDSSGGNTTPLRPKRFSELCRSPTADSPGFLGADGKRRCFGGQCGKELYGEYHDREWGVPVHDDRRLFEMLILEGAQAGLSWETILKRREGYRTAFHAFDPVKVAAMLDKELEALLHNPAIIRNRLKIFSARQNAQVFLQLQKEYVSFAHYVWGFVGGKPIVNHWRCLEEIPTTTPESDALSKDLKKHGMSFVGSTILYAFMQAVGLVNDHISECFTRASTAHNFQD